MAISANTPDRLILDAGTVTVATVDIGATMGGVTFTVEKEILQPKLDGARGPLAGVGWIITEVPKLTARFTELQVAKIQYALPGSTMTSDVSSEVLGDTTVGYMASTLHGDVVYTGAKADGTAITITVENAIVVDNLEMGFNDENILVYELTFQGCYLVADPDDAPYAIMNTLV